jgi:hypothetical protein
LIRVRKLMCLLSIFCVCAFPTVCCSADDCTAFAHSQMIRCLRLQDQVRHHQQLPRSLRRNALPVKRINRSLLVCHEHLACALV